MRLNEEDAEVYRLLGFIGGQEQVIKSRVLSMFDYLQSNRTLTAFQRFYKQSRYKLIFALVDDAVEDCANVLDEVFAVSGEKEMRSLTQKFGVVRVSKDFEVDPSISLSFEVGNAEAASLLQQSKLSFIKEITDAQRETIRQALNTAQLQGLGAVHASNLFKDSIGLTEHQRSVVDNYKKSLVSGSDDALSRTLRDRRFDPTVRSALNAGRSLEPAQIDRMVVRYRERMIAMRAETIARTEAIAAVNAARFAAMNQMTKQLGIKQTDLIRTWRTVIDGRQRHTHNSMNGQQREGKKPFKSPSGAMLKFPGDRSAPAGEIINCRCVVLQNLAENVTPTTQLKPTNTIAAQPPVNIPTSGVLATDSFVAHPKAGYHVPKTPVKAPKLPSVDSKKFKVIKDNYSEYLSGLYKKTFKTPLNSLERHALTDYTKQHYKNLNQHLRSGDKAGLSLYSNTLKPIDSAMAKAKLPEDLTVFRSVSPEVFKGLTKKLKVGESLVVDKAFLSTTVSRKVVQEYAGASNQIIKILLPKGSKAIPVSVFSYVPWEAEILINRGSVFTVRKVSKNEIVLQLGKVKSVSKPVSTVKPKPVSTVKPKPVSTVKPKPVKVPKPKPAPEARPVPTVQPEPVKSPSGLSLDAESLVVHPEGSYYVPKKPIKVPALSGKPVSDFKEYDLFTSSSAMDSLSKTSFTTSLTNLEVKAVSAYTKAGYKTLNKIMYKTLRSSALGEVDPSVAGFVHNLDLAIAKTSLSEDLQVFRGIGSASRFEALKRNLKAGDTLLLDKGYMSTSLDASRVTMFTQGSESTRLKILLPKGSKALPVGEMTAYKQEREILLGRNSMFVVREVTENEIVLELIPSA